MSIIDFIEGGCYMGLESHFRSVDTKLSGTYKNSCKETIRCMNMLEDFSYLLLEYVAEEIKIWPLLLK